MAESNESSWEELAGQLDALFAHKVSLGPLKSGDGVILEVENTTGDKQQVLFSTEHVPQVALSLLRGQQIAASSLPQDQLVRMLERSQDYQVKNPVQARSAKIVATPDQPGISLLVHCGTTFIHFRLPDEAAKELRTELDQALEEPESKD